MTAPGPMASMLQSTLYKPIQIPGLSNKHVREKVSSNSQLQHCITFWNIFGIFILLYMN